MADRRQARRTLRLLQRVGELLMRGWTRETLAKNSLREATSPCSKDAVRWCVRGALQRASWELRMPAAKLEAACLIGGENGMEGSLTAWNDSQTSKRPVLSAVGRAITKLRNELRAS